MLSSLREGKGTKRKDALFFSSSIVIKASSISIYNMVLLICIHQFIIQNTSDLGIIQIEAELQFIFVTCFVIIF